MLILACVMGVGRFAYTPILPFMQSDHALTTSQAGWIATANFIGYLIGALSAGHTRFSQQPSRWAALAVALSILSTAAMALPIGFAGWALVRFVSGVASAFAMVCMSTVVLRYLGSQGRSDLAAMPYIGVGSAIALSAILVFIMQSHSNSAGMWLVLAGLALVCGLVGSRWLIQIPRIGEPLGPSAIQMRPQAEVSRNQTALRFLVIGYSCLGFGYVITATFMVVIVRAMGYASWLETAAWVATGLAAVVTNSLWHRLASHLGAHGVLIIQHVLLAAGVLLPVMFQGVMAALIGGVLLGATFMSATGLILAEGRALRADQPQRAIGQLTAGFGLGQMLGPAVASAWVWWAAPFNKGGAELVGPSWMAAGVLLCGAAAIGHAKRLSNRSAT